MVAAAEELNLVTKSLKVALGETAGQFRQAANASTANLSKIVKDIATTFRAQQNSIAELSNTMEEASHEAQQTSSKLDTLTSLFQESLSLQTRMLSETQSITRNIRILNDSTESMNKNLQGALIGDSKSVLSSLTTLDRTVAGLAIAGGAAVISQTGGGGGGSTSPAGSYKESNKFYDAIISSEGTGKHGDPYNTSLGYRNSPKPLTQMTMKESLAWGEEIARQEMARTGKSRGAVSSAKGAFQIVNQTQTSAMKALGIGENELFSVENQKRMASWIAHAQGLRAWEGLKIHPDKMRIAQEAMNEGADKDLTTSSRTDTSSIPKASSASEATPTSTATPVSTSFSGSATTPSATKVSASLPSGDIVALGHSLEKQGFRISEHPQFGGVKGATPDKPWGIHSRSGGHGDGTAIDVNIGTGNIEENNPEMAAKFDKLAEQLRSAGYKVIWRAPGHHNHLHAQMLKGGATGGEQTTPTTTPVSAASPVTPNINMASMPSAPTAATDTEPMATPTSTAAPLKETSGINQMAMMAGMLPGGMGGIIGSLLPMLGSMTNMLSAELQPSVMQNQLAQNVPTSALINEAISQTAVEKQAQMENQQAAAAAPTVVQPDSITPANYSNPTAQGHAYYDTGWPDWATMIGGNHWEEMKNFKTSMWG